MLILTANRSKTYMALGLREDISLSSRGPKPAIFTIINRQHHDYNGVVRQTKNTNKKENEISK